MIFAQILENIVLASVRDRVVASTIEIMISIIFSHGRANCARLTGAYWTIHANCSNIPGDKHEIERDKETSIAVECFQIFMPAI